MNRTNQTTPFQSFFLVHELDLHNQKEFYKSLRVKTHELDHDETEPETKFQSLLACTAQLCTKNI